MSTKKKFCRDDPHGGDGSAFLYLPILLPLSVTAALGLPLALAVRGLAIASSRLPLPPPAGFHLARLTAIARHRLFRPKDPPAALQQTDPAPGTTSSPRPPGTIPGILYAKPCRSFGCHYVADGGRPIPQSSDPPMPTGVTYCLLLATALSLGPDNTSLSAHTLNANVSTCSRSLTPDQRA